MNLSLVINKNR